jgi:hypothetical protein
LVIFRKNVLLVLFSRESDGELESFFQIWWWVKQRIWRGDLLFYGSCRFLFVFLEVDKRRRYDIDEKDKLMFDGGYAFCHAWFLKI